MSPPHRIKTNGFVREVTSEVAQVWSLSHPVAGIENLSFHTVGCFRVIGSDVGPNAEQVVLCGIGEPAELHAGLRPAFQASFRTARFSRISSGLRNWPALARFQPSSIFARASAFHCS